MLRHRELRQACMHRKKERPGGGATQNEDVPAGTEASSARAWQSPSSAQASPSTLDTPALHPMPCMRKFWYVRITLFQSKVPSAHRLSQQWILTGSCSNVWGTKQRAVPRYLPDQVSSFLCRYLLRFGGIAAQLCPVRPPAGDCEQSNMAMMEMCNQLAPLCPSS